MKTSDSYAALFRDFYRKHGLKLDLPLLETLQDELIDTFEGEIEDEARQVLANLKAVLEAAGSGMDRVVKATVYLTDLSLFPRVNAVYAEAFDVEPAPARVTVGVAALPLGAQVEIDAIALAD